MSVAAVDVQYDDALVMRAAEGDREAFGELYERYFQGIYDFAAHTVRDRDLARDVVQTTFTRAWEALQKGTRPQNPKAWLYTIARNDAIDQMRRAQRVVPTPRVHDDDDGSVSWFDTRPDPDRTPEELVGDREVASLVWQAASALNPRQYSLLDLHLRQQLSPDELASSLGLRRDNVYMMLSRLRDSLEESVSLLLLAQRGRRECPELDVLLAGHNTLTLTRAARRVVRKHLDECERCQEQARRYVSPSEIFAGLAPLPIPAELGRTLWERIAPQLNPVPLGSPLPGPHAAPVPSPPPAPVVPPGLETGLWWAQPALLVKLGAAATSTVVGLALVVAVVTHQATPAAALARDPEDVRSTSHRIGQPSSASIVELVWSPVADATGYSVMWTAQPRDLPDALADLPGSAGATRSEPLPPGTWYFHLRTRGPDGSWTSTVHLGPFIIVPPPPPEPPPAAAVEPASEPEAIVLSAPSEEEEAELEIALATAESEGPAEEEAAAEPHVLASAPPRAIPTAPATPTVPPSSGDTAAFPLPEATATLRPASSPTSAVLRSPTPSPASPAAPTSTPGVSLPPPPVTATPAPFDTMTPTPVPTATAEEVAPPLPSSTATSQPFLRSVAAGPSSLPTGTAGATATSDPRPSEPGLPTATATHTSTRPPTRTPTRTLSPTLPRPSETAVAPPPTGTPCLPLVVTGLSADVQAERVTIQWVMTGGCPPYSGSVTASVQGGPSYTVGTITTLAGSISDVPPRCAGLVTYRVTLRDASGATQSVTRQVSVDRDC